ncbi:hypothetical protein ACFL4D_01985, partial [Candidatus Margulisiibacteriota bacterium]
MNDNLFQYLTNYGLRLDHTHLPIIYLSNGETQDPQIAINNYIQFAHSFGSVDLWLLGIGSDGHYAFLEPAVMLEKYLLENGEVDFDNPELISQIRDFNEFYIPFKDGEDVKACIEQVLAIQQNQRGRLKDDELLIQAINGKRRVPFASRKIKYMLDMLCARMREESISSFFVDKEFVTDVKKHFSTDNRINILPLEEYFGSEGKVVHLALPTIIDNSRYFADINDVPRQALTVTGLVPAISK